MRNVDAATVHGRRLNLPQEICSVSRKRLRWPKGNLTAGQKSAEGILGQAVGKASKELTVRPLETSALCCGIVLDGHKFVPELFGLALEFRFEPLLPLSISGSPDCFVIFDLIQNDGCKRSPRFCVRLL
jgi:hypothetical protein